MCITMCVSNILSCVGCVEVPDRCDMYNVLCICSMYTPVLVVFRFPIPNKLHMSKLIQLVVADNHIPLFSLFLNRLPRYQCGLIMVVCYDNHHTCACELHYWLIPHVVTWT